MDKLQEQINEINNKISKLSERSNQVTFLDPISQNIIKDYVSTLNLDTNEVHGLSVFTSDGTFTVPSGVNYIWVEAVGGGAGSGWSTYPDSGGGGAYCAKLIDVSAVSSISVTIGAGGTGASTSSARYSNTDGGDTIFGSYFTAGGGQNDGTGGTATGGDININGGNADIAIFYSHRTTSTNDGLSGRGGNSMFGFGGVPAHAVAGGNYAPGNVGVGYGAGASSAVSAGGSGADAAGANGTSGLVIVRY